MAIYGVLGDRTTKFRSRQVDAFEPMSYEDEYWKFSWLLQSVKASVEWEIIYAGMVVVVLLMLSPFVPLYLLWVVSAAVFGHHLPLVASGVVLVPSS